mgnify:CR=1 FL=1
MKTFPIKIVMVGDSKVGKTSLQYTFENGHFPEEYIPTIFNSYCQLITLSKEQTTFRLQIWDTAGSRDYDNLRHLSYPMTDIFLLCFSLISRKTFNNIADKWIKEVRHHCPGVPVILVGLKSDLKDNFDRSRLDSNSISEMSDSVKDQIPIELHEGNEMKEQIGAISYIEISSKENINVYEVFEFSCRYFYRHCRKTENSKAKCLIE